MNHKALFLFFMVGTAATAAEQNGNPDRFPSVGLTFDGQELAGDPGLLGYLDHENLLIRQLVLDIRYPVSSTLTFSGALGAIDSNLAKENTDLFSSGFTYSISARFYIH